MAEMRLFHYTYINNEYHGDVIASWESGGCFDDVRYRLGYVMHGGRTCVLRRGSPC